MLPTGHRNRRGPAAAGRGGEADERRQSRLPLRDPAGPRRAGARARDERPGRPDLPDHVLHVRRRRPRGAPLRAPAVREHLHPDHEPDHRRLREADRRARGRRRRARHRERPGRPVPGALHDPPERRQRRLHELPLRRDLQPVQGLLPAARHRHEVHRGGQPGGLREGHRRAHPRPVRRDDRQPPLQRAGLRGPGQDRPRPRDPPRGGQHLRGRRLHLPPHRLRRRHRRRLGHQVDRRPRHLDRRRDRGRRQVRLGQREVPRVHRARPRLPRPQLLGDLRPEGPVRQHRVHHPRPGRGPARLRALPLALQLVPLPAGARDAVSPRAAAQRQRDRAREVAGEAPGGDLGQPPEPPFAPLARAREEVPEERLRRRS